MTASHCSTAAALRAALAAQAPLYLTGDRIIIRPDGYCSDRPLAFPSASFARALMRIAAERVQAADANPLSRHAE